MNTIEFIKENYIDKKKVREAIDKIDDYPNFARSEHMDLLLKELGL